MEQYDLRYGPDFERAEKERLQGLVGAKSILEHIDYVSYQCLPTVATAAVFGLILIDRGSVLECKAQGNLKAGVLAGAAKRVRAVRDGAHSPPLTDIG